MVRLVDSLLQRPSYSYRDASSPERRHEHHRHARPTLVAQSMPRPAFPVQHQQHRQQHVRRPAEPGSCCLVPHAPPTRGVQHPAAHHSSPALYARHLAPVASSAPAPDHAHTSLDRLAHAHPPSLHTSLSELPAMSGLAIPEAVPALAPASVSPPAQLHAPAPAAYPMAVGARALADSARSATPSSPSAAGVLPPVPGVSLRCWGAAAGPAPPSRPFSTDLSAPAPYTPSHAPPRPRLESSRPRQPRLRYQSASAASAPFYSAHADHVRTPSLQQAANDVVGTWTGAEDTSLTPGDLLAPRPQAPQARPAPPPGSSASSLSAQLSDGIRPCTIEQFLSASHSSLVPHTEASASPSPTPTPSLDPWHASSYTQSPAAAHALEPGPENVAASVAHSLSLSGPDDSSHYSREDSDTGSEDDRNDSWDAQSPSTLSR